MLYTQQQRVLMENTYLLKVALVNSEANPEAVYL